LNFGSVVLKHKQFASGDGVNLEVSIANYDNEPIFNYSASSKIAEIGKVVGRLDILTDAGTFPCTAFLVSNEHLLTNNHCAGGHIEINRGVAGRGDDARVGLRQ
jgi:hypothetical protein